MSAVTVLGPGGYPVSALPSSGPSAPLAGYRSMVGFWLGGLNTHPRVVTLSGYRSMVAPWLGGLSTPPGGPPPVGGDYLAPTYFIGNCGRFLGRRGL